MNTLMTSPLKILVLIGMLLAPLSAWSIELAAAKQQGLVGEQANGYLGAVAAHKLPDYVRSGFTHRTHRCIAGVMDGDTTTVHRPVALPDGNIESFFKAFPEIGRAGCRMHDFYGVVAVVRSFRLFHQYRYHGPDGIELGGFVMPDAIPEPGRRELFVGDKPFIEAYSAGVSGVAAVTATDRLVDLAVVLADLVEGKIGRNVTGLERGRLAAFFA